MFKTNKRVKQLISSLLVITILLSNLNYFAFAEGGGTGTVTERFVLADDKSTVSEDVSAEYEAGEHTFNPQTIEGYTAVTTPQAITVVASENYTVTHEYTKDEVPTTETGTVTERFLLNNNMSPLLDEVVTVCNVGVKTFEPKEIEGYTAVTTPQAIDIKTNETYIVEHLYDAKVQINTDFDVETDALGTTVVTRYKGSGGDVVIPSTINGKTITGVGDRTPFFTGMDASKITSITLGEGIKYVEINAFANCINLQNVVLPNTLEVGGAYTFAGCKSLKSIVLPNGLSYIGDGMFNLCTSLEFVQFPANLQRIYPDAFSGCKSLKSVTLPKSVVSIGDGVFADCNNLKDITLPQGLMTNLNKNLFSYCYNLVNINEVDNSNNIVTTKVHKESGVDFTLNSAVQNFINGESVEVSSIFQDVNLANYFVDWYNAFATSTITVNSEIDYDNLRERFNQYTWDPNVIHNNEFAYKFNASNKNITNLEGIQIFYTLNTFKKMLVLDLSNNNITNLEPLKSLESIDIINISNNKLTDVNILKDLIEVKNTINYANNYVRNIPDLSKFNCNIDMRNNYIDPTTIKDNLLPIISVANMNQEHFKTPQYGFKFDEISKAKVEYRVKDTNELLGEDTYDVAAGTYKIVDAKYFKGYQAVDVSKTLSGSNDTYPIAYSCKRILLPSNVDAPLTATDTIDYLSKDESILKGLNITGLGTTQIEIRLNNISLGDYSITNTTPLKTNIMYYLPIQTLNVVVEGEGEVYKAGDMFAIEASRNYPKATTFNLIAKPLIGSNFVKWNINGVDYLTSTIAIKMDEDKNVKAIFDKQAAPTGKLTVHYKYEDGSKAFEDKVTNNIILPSTIPEFPPFLLDYKPDMTSRIITLDNANPTQEITFTYTKINILSLNLQTIGNGSITATHQETMNNYPSITNTTLTFESGAHVNLSAFSNFGSSFVKWDVDGVDFLDPWLPLTLDGNKTVTAHFQITPTFKLYKEVRPAGAGDIMPIGTTETINANMMWPLMCTANPGYKFEKWIVDGVEDKNAMTNVKMDKDKTAIACFASTTERNLDVVENLDDKVLSKEESLNFTSNLGSSKYPIGDTAVVETHVGTGYELVKLGLKERYSPNNPWGAEHFFMKGKGIEIDMYDDCMITAYYKTKAVVTPIPTILPTVIPTVLPTVVPTTEPTVKPTEVPTILPTIKPTVEPTIVVVNPTIKPTVVPTAIPTVKPTIAPTVVPTVVPTVKPTAVPTIKPTIVPTAEPTIIPTLVPTVEPTLVPTIKPTLVPIVAATAKPQEVAVKDINAINPTPKPVDVVIVRTPSPTVEPTILPIVEPTIIPEVLVTPKPQVVEKGIVYGVITDNAGKPLANVLVELHSKPRQVFTNARGEYRFSGVELGNHELLVKNPYTLKEISKIQVIAYKEADKKVTKEVEKTKEVKESLQLTSKHKEARLDFILDPKDLEKTKEKTKFPWLPLTVLLATVPPIFLFIAYFARRKNVIVYNQDGRILTFLKIKALAETIIDLNGFKAELFKIKFRNASSFRKLKLFVQYNNKKYEVKLPVGSKTLTFDYKYFNLKRYKVDFDTELYANITDFVNRTRKIIKTK